MDGLGALVLEVSGLGPWDVLTVTGAAYAAAATSLNLATGAPSAASFMLAAVAGDNDSASQAFAPAGWTTLHTVTATNGTNHVSDVVLTSAYLASNSSSVSVNATASAEDLSGVLIGIELAAPSPITGTGIAAGWPGRMIVEMALGAGFETPADQLTWTTLNDSGVAPGPGVTKRFWGWADQGGIPYALAGLQSGTGTVTLDDAAGDLTPSNSASPWYPDIVTGTPVRLRVALGTLTGPLGSTVVNRWYVIQRNMLDAEEKRDSNMRNFVDMSLTDIWSVVSGSCPSPYRGEVRQDNPYAWWTGDDQPLSGGVLPTTLRNSAAGNTNVLNITLSPGGGILQFYYDEDGNSTSGFQAPSVPVYAVGASQGWMYGDPQSSPASYATSNPVTASPGSAAWQASGQGGNTGSYGYFLSCNDASFPVLANGVTVEGWFSYPFFGSGSGLKITSVYPVCQQPQCALTIVELATGSHPVAVLQLDTSGHLNLITYNGSTGTSHSIYTASDLRSNSWHHYAVELTTTTWTVYVDGGATAEVSGTATGMTSAWTWLIVNGDLAANGGSSAGTGLVHGGNVSAAHLAVYPSLLPASRVMAHYWAAFAGFGQIPAPTGVTVQLALTTGSSSTGINGNYYATDGTARGGSYVSYTTGVLASALATANAPGGLTSGPSPRATGSDWQASNGALTDSLWVQWTSVAPSNTVYTADASGAETAAGVTCGSGDSFTSGYGSGASGAGVCQTAAGSGASPPTAPSALGDTVTQRLERILGYGLVTNPGRAIDTTPNLVQAALDIGGQAAGASINNLVQSDNGWLSVDAPGNLCYRAKAHLAADTVVWDLSSAGPSSGYPFRPGQTFKNDPQKVWNVIQIGQYSPDGATLPVTTPASASAVNTSQTQCGPRPLPWSSSYLQSQSEIQSQANWLIAQYGTVHRRAESLTVDAAGYPPAWIFVLGVSPGDLVQITDLPMQGGPQSVGTYRVSSVSRRIFFGANGNRPEGSVTVTCDYEPTSYWS